VLKETVGVSGRQTRNVIYLVSCEVERVDVAKEVEE